MAKTVPEATVEDEREVENKWIRPNHMKWCIWCRIFQSKSRTTCRLCNAALVAGVGAITMGLIFYPSILLPLIGLDTPDTIA